MPPLACTLCLATCHEVAERISPRLLSALVRCGVYSVDDALEVVAHKVTAAGRAESIAAISGFLDGPTGERALALLARIDDVTLEAMALAALASEGPLELVSRALLQSSTLNNFYHTEVSLAALPRLQRDEQRAFVTRKLTSCAKQPLNKQLLIIERLAPFVRSEAQRRRAVELLEAQPPADRARLLAALAPKLAPQVVVAQAVEALAGLVEGDDEARASLLSQIATHGEHDEARRAADALLSLLPSLRVDEVACAALSSTAAGDEAARAHARAALLTRALAPSLPQPRRAACLDALGPLLGEADQANALDALVHLDAHDAASSLSILAPSLAPGLRARAALALRDRARREPRLDLRAAALARASALLDDAASLDAGRESVEAARGCPPRERSAALADATPHLPPPLRPEACLLALEAASDLASLRACADRLAEQLDQRTAAHAEALLRAHDEPEGRLRFAAALYRQLTEAGREALARDIDAAPPALRAELFACISMHSQAALHEAASGLDLIDSLPARARALALVSPGLAATAARACAASLARALAAPRTTESDRAAALFWAAAHLEDPPLVALSSPALSLLAGRAFDGDDALVSSLSRRAIPRLADDHRYRQLDDSETAAVAACFDGPAIRLAPLFAHALSLPETPLADLAIWRLVERLRDLDAPSLARVRATVLVIAGTRPRPRALSLLSLTAPLFSGLGDSAARGANDTVRLICDAFDPRIVDRPR